MNKTIHIRIRKYHGIMSTSTLGVKIKNSLEILTEMHGISEAQLCRETSISQATLWRLFNGETDPRASTLNAIAAYFNITIDQLVGNQPIVKSSGRKNAAQSTSCYLPIFSLESPTEINKMLGKTLPSNWNKWLDVESSIKNSSFAVEINGDSMWPDFTEGSLIIVDSEIIAKHRNYILCRLHKTNEILFRQYIEERNEKFLKPINYAYKTIPLQKNDVILGVVIQSRNKFIE